MSPRSSKKKTAAGPKPAVDVWVGFLFISLAALISGITFLYLQLERYGWKMGP